MALVGLKMHFYSQLVIIFTNVSSITLYYSPDRRWKSYLNIILRGWIDLPDNCALNCLLNRNIAFWDINFNAGVTLIVNTYCMASRETVTLLSRGMGRSPWKRLPRLLPIPKDNMIDCSPRSHGISVLLSNLLYIFC